MNGEIHSMRSGSDTRWEEKSAEVRAESSGSVSEVPLSNHHYFLFKATKTKSPPQPLS